MLQQQWPRIFRQIRVGYNFCQNHYYSSEINSVPLTTDRYPNVKRGDFAILQESDVKFFESIIGPFMCSKLSRFSDIKKFMNQRFSVIR